MKASEARAVAVSSVAVELGSVLSAIEEEAGKNQLRAWFWLHTDESARCVALGLRNLGYDVSRTGKRLFVSWAD